MERFVQALKEEIRKYGSYAIAETVETIFFGGGTPSLLPVTDLRSILTELRETFRVIPDAEISLEANPGTVNAKKLKEFRSAGINRLSFGVQSFLADDLKFLTRIHSADEAKNVVRLAQDIGFDNINIDLMFSLPNQTMQKWEKNLRQAVELRTQHISAYSLIVEEGTPLARMVRAKQVSPLPTETEASMYEFTMEYLASHGFYQYEVSNFAKPGFRCRHNNNYWMHANYLGFGPSAHSFWLNRRWWNISNVTTYIERISRGSLPLADEELLQPVQLADEAVMLGLRSEGINLRRLKEQLGVDILQAGREEINRLVNEKLAIFEEPTLRLSSKGMLVCDEISQVLLSRVSAA